jgi:hypothetical protein
MAHSFKLSRRIARLRALVTTLLAFTLVGCGTDSLDPDSSTSPDPADPATLDGSTLQADAVPVAEAAPVASASYAGGIPFGTFSQPTGTFGSMFNGAQRIIYPQYLVRELAAIKARGGKVAIRLSYTDRYLKDSQGNFVLSKWKERVSRYKGVNFSPYINDGTIIGHYLLDDPQDPTNWNGKPIPQSTIEEMARFSKQLWPNMPTIVRTWPDYLDNWSGNYRYLDAAWAQYTAKRWPNAEAFLRENVSKAKARGLALVVGMNILDGSPTKGRMSASQVRSYGSALLGDSYPCAFLSWQYRDDYMTASVKDAMRYLRNKAQNRGFKSCRGS